MHDSTAISNYLWWKNIRTQYTLLPRPLFLYAYIKHTTANKKGVLVLKTYNMSHDLFVLKNQLCFT